MGDWNSTVPTFATGEELLASKLQTGSDLDSALSGVWTAWTPTITNMTLGNGTITAAYRRIGKTLDYRFRFLLGSTSAVGTQPLFTLPYTPSAFYTSTEPMGDVMLLDQAVATRRGSTRFFSGSTLEVLCYTTTGVLATITTSVPHTWNTGDVMSCAGTIELL